MPLASRPSLVTICVLMSMLNNQPLHPVSDPMTRCIVEFFKLEMSSKQHRRASVIDPDDHIDNVYHRTTMATIGDGASAVALALEAIPPR